MKKLTLILAVMILYSCSSFTNGNKNILSGHFSYLADAAVFVDCQTGEKYPVAMEGDYIKLEREYLEISESDGQKILVNLEGEYIERNKIEGEGRQKFLVVNKFIEFMPNQSCR